MYILKNRHQIKNIILLTKWHNYFLCNNKINYSKVTHTIFDLDGTILATQKIYNCLFESIAKRYRKKFTDELLKKIVGRVDKDVARIFIKELKLSINQDEFLDQLHDQSLKLLPNCELLPGAERLLNHLHYNKVPMAIATSSGEKSVAAKFRHRPQMLNLFHHIIKGSTKEVKNGKPAPDIFLECATRFDEKPEPKKCLVFEDAPNGVEAGVRANMQVVCVPDSIKDLSLFKGATLILNSLEEFKPELFGLPPFK